MASSIRGNPTSHSFHDSVSTNQSMTSTRQSSASTFLTMPSTSTSTISTHSSSSIVDTDLAFAELELLNQNQRKLQNLTSRMTSILSGFDKRLGKLESSILPIHKSTQRLLRVGENIDATLSSLDKTMGHFDVVQSEEPLILRGPNVEHINPYLDTMDRVLKGLKYLQRSDLQSQQSVLLKMYDLIEIGSMKLCEIISDWVTAESNPIDIGDYISSSSSSVPHNRREFPTFSSATYQAITPILSYLKSLPNHPSTGFSPFLHGLSTLSDIRSAYLDSSISPLGAKVLEYAIEKMGSENGAGGMAGMTSAFGLMGHDDDDEDGHASSSGAGHRRGNAGAETWIEGMVLMAESEYNTISALLSSLSPPSSTATIQSTFSRVLKSPLSTFSIQLSSIHSHIKRNLITHTFFALDLLGAMQGTTSSSSLGSGAASRWDQIMLTCAGKGKESGREEGADGAIMTETILSIRGTLLQVFPKFIEDIRIMPSMREGEVPSTTVNEITYSGLKFINQLVGYKDVVVPLLKTLGNGNWMMSRGTAPVLSLGFEDDDQGILTSYLNDVLATVLSALEARSRAIRQLSTASIFLLNNIGHLKRELAHSGILSSQLGETGEQLLISAMRTANTSYLDAWGPVVSALMEEQVQPQRGAKLAGLGGGGEKAAVKDRFAKFYEGLEDLERLHRAYPISKEDVELKEKLRNDVIRMICPLYSRFVAKHKAGDFSKNPSKHIRLTDQELQSHISKMF